MEDDTFKYGYIWMGSGLDLNLGLLRMRIKRDINWVTETLKNNC